LKNKKIFIWASVFIAFFGILFLIGYLVKKDFEKDLGNMMGESIKETPLLSEVVVAYRIKYEQWPQNPGELQKLIKSDKLFREYDLNAYKGLKFINTKKILTISYESYKKGKISTGPGHEEIDISPSK